MKALKWIAIGVGGLVLVGIAFLVFFVATFDPNRYKPQIVALVKERTGRTLDIEGKIGLSIFPTLGAHLSKVTLSEPNGARSFARVEDARVGVAVLPLLSKQVKVDRVVLKGLAVDLVRYKDGRSNFDDLTGQAAQPGPAQAQAPGAPPLAVDVGSIAIEQSAIGWRDERDGTDVRLTDVTLKTGRLANDVPGTLEFAAQVNGAQPPARLHLTLDTGYRLNFDTQAVALSDLNAKATGDAQGFTGIDASLKGKTIDLDSKSQRVTLSKVELTAKSKDGLDAKLAVPRLQLAPNQAESETIAGDLKLATPQRTVAAKLQIAPLAAKGQQVHFSRMDVEFSTRQGDLSAQGKLATPVTLDLDKRRAELPEIAGEVTVGGNAIPNHSMKSTLKGNAQADWGAQSANADLALQLDQSNIHTTLAVAHWGQPALTFSLVADRLNLDQYLASSKPGAAPTGGKGAPQPEQPFDLSPLKTLNATGDVKVGALQVSNIKAEQVAVHLKAAGGRLDLNPISANLYQGTLAGTASVNANDDHMALKQRLAGVSVGPLLRDAANKDLLEGRGNVALDVTSAGTTVTALKKALAGTANVALRDGTIKGIDIAGTLRSAKAMLGSKNALEQQAQGGAKTDFTEMTASFVIKNGVAHNDDLQMKSPLLRLAGSGDVNIAEGTLDYTTKASVVASAGGQGGKELSQLSGVTIPVRASGPLANLKYTVDVAGLASEFAKGAVQQEIQRRLGGKAGSSQGGAAGSVENALKGLGGLFGKPK
jgi:AsmA protein